MPTKLYQLETIYYRPNFMNKLEDEFLESKWEQRILFTNEELAMEGMKKEVQRMKNLGGTDYFTDEIQDFRDDPDDYLAFCSNDNLVRDNKSDSCIYDITLTILSEDLEKDAKDGLKIWSEF